MTIMASADIRLKYNDVVDKCRESGEPVFLTKNGQGVAWLLNRGCYVI